MSVLGRKIQILIITTSLDLCTSLVPLWADDRMGDGLRIAVDGAGCVRLLGALEPVMGSQGALVEAPPRVSPLTQFLRYLTGNMFARMPATSVASTQSYDARPEPGIRVHYVQSLPGKSKFLRGRLTAEELNVLFNQVRTLFLSSGIVSGQNEIQVDFKSTRYNISVEAEDSNRILELVDRAEAAFKNLQSPYFNSSLLGPNAEAFMQSRFIVVGSGATEMQAILAGRFSTDVFAKYEDVRDQVQDALLKIPLMAGKLRETLSKEPEWAVLLDENSENFSLKFFKILREAETREDVVDRLEQLHPNGDPVRTVELADKMFGFFKYLDKFVPGTQYRREQLAVVDDENGPKDMSYPEGTGSVLVADVRGAGARILRETLETIESAIGSISDENAIIADAVIEKIHIRNSIQFLEDSLQAAIESVRKSEGDNLISYWITGDEVVFYLRDPSSIHTSLNGERPFRISEERLHGFDNLNRLENALLREVSEKAMKILEEQMPELKAQSLSLMSGDQGLSIEVYLDSLPDWIDEALTEARLRDVLQSMYPDFEPMKNLRVDLISRTPQPSP